MRYVSLAEAWRADGLRLVVTRGTPAPWSEAAKAIFRIKGISYLPVAQDAGEEDPELVAWTGQGAAPAAIYADERPYIDSLDILFLAERLAPSPPLIPAAAGPRVEVLGLSREIVGRRGLGWSRRTMIVQAAAKAGALPAQLARVAARHGVRPDLEPDAEALAAQILSHLAERLTRQRAAGSSYLVGDALTAADVYWATFSIIFSPPGEEACPLAPDRRARLGALTPTLAEALSPILIDHRDYILEEYVGLPLSF